MIVRTSHRLEDLVSALAERVAVPCAGSDGPIARETISVQGRGMERWLSMQLSRRLGVWANPDFPFPRHLIERAFDAVAASAPPGPGQVAPERFEPDSLTWAIAARLGEISGDARFDEVQRYLDADPSPRRRVQLASRLARRFDDYVVYRPEMVTAWEEGAASQDWQAVLWRSLVGRGQPLHLAARSRAFVEKLAAGSGPIPGFPDRVTLFGITTLPPLYVELLAALGRRVDLQLFLLHCDLHCEKDDRGRSNESPLQTSLGEVGRQFHRILAERGVPVERVASGTERGQEPGFGEVRKGSAASPPSLLHAVQEAVRGAPPAGRPDLFDGSIGIHACPGPMREVEVLRDQLRALFEADPGLEPHDVIVMTPDIDRYGPFVEAAFETAEGGAGRAIDYRLADRGIRATHPVVDALWALMDALEGRLGASVVVDLLMIDRIRSRFGIREDDLETVIEWVRGAGIRWGADPSHRVEHGQPALRQNTWQEGIDRLMLARALPDGSRDLFCGARAAGPVDPADTVRMARFVEFVEALFAFRSEICEARSLDGWRQLLSRLLDELIDPAGDGAAEQARIREALSELAQRASAADFDEAVPLSCVRDALSDSLERAVGTHRFLSGGVTVCQLVPMRSIPFRVVALLGLDDGAFPRAEISPGFDRLAADPRPGDRTRRDDDRYLFLEALMSARDHLLVTYSGRSLRDGASRSPSVVVEELIDEAFRVSAETDREARERLVVRHPLHAFSRRYFDGSDERLFSHAGSECEAARASELARVRPRAPAAWLRQALPGADVDEPVDLAELARFFEHPVRAFLQERLGLYLRDEVRPLEDREALGLSALEQWAHRDALLRERLEGCDPATAAARVRADGRLPPGALGDLAERQSQQRVERLLHRVRELQGGDALAPIAVDLQIGRFRLVGRIGDLYPGGRIVQLLSQLPHARELSFWIHHLALCCHAAGVPEVRLPTRSILLARQKKAGEEGLAEIHLGRCAEPESILEPLLELFAAGRSLPIPLLRRASRAQAEVSIETGFRAGPASRARKAWEQRSGDIPSEREDPYYAQAFRDVDPLDPNAALPGPGFAELARDVYEPYLRARETGP